MAVRSDALGLNADLAASCRRLLEATEHNSGPRDGTFVDDPVLLRLHDVLRLHVQLTQALASPAPASASGTTGAQGGSLPPAALTACAAGCSRRSAALEDAASKLGQLGCAMRAVLDDVHLQAPTLENGHIPSVDEVLQYGHRIRFSTFAHAGIFSGETAPQPLHMAFTRMMALPVQLPPPPAASHAQQPPPQHAPQQQQLVDPFTAYIRLGDYFPDLADREPVAVPRQFLPPEFVRSGDPIPQGVLAMLRETMEEASTAAVAAVSMEVGISPSPLPAADAFPAGSAAAAAERAMTMSLQGAAQATAAGVLADFFDDDEDDDEDDEDDESD